MDNVWESEYIDVYDKILLNADIYLAVRDFHVNAMRNCAVVLDSGCGTGNVALELLKRGSVVYTIDNSKKAIDTLRDRSGGSSNIKLYEGNAENLPFDDETFDGITSMFMLSYINNPTRYLEEHFRVLKNNGIFALSWRVTSNNINLVADSYEDSLRNRGMLPKMQKEMDVFREKLLSDVKKSVNEYMLDEIKSIMSSIGYRDIQQFPNPYFGQCYSLTARK